METNNQGVQYLASMLELPAPGPVTVTWPGFHRQERSNWQEEPSCQ